MVKMFKKIYSFSSSWTGTVVIVLFFIFFVAQAFIIPSGSMKNTLLIGDFLFVKKFSYGIPTPHIPFLEIQVLPDINKDGHLISGSKPKRGDIVVFRYPLNPKMHFVKRNFAVGGDEVIFYKNTMFLRPNEGDKFIEQNYNKDDIVILLGKKFVREPYKFKGIHYTDNKQSAFDLATNLVLRSSQGFAMSPIKVSELEPLILANSHELDFNAFYKKVEIGEFFMVGDNRNNSQDSRFWGSVEYKYVVGKPWFVYMSIDSNKEIRWERIGRSAYTLQNDSRYIYEQP